MQTSHVYQALRAAASGQELRRVTKIMQSCEFREFFFTFIPSVVIEHL